MIARILATYFSRVTPIRHIIKIDFARYHAKGISFCNTKKIFELKHKQAISYQNNYSRRWV